MVWVEGRGATAGEAMKDLEEALEHRGPGEMVDVRLALTNVPKCGPNPEHVAAVVYGFVSS